MLMCGLNTHLIAEFACVLVPVLSILFVCVVLGMSFVARSCGF